MVTGGSLDESDVAVGVRPEGRTLHHERDAVARTAERPRDTLRKGEPKPCREPAARLRENPENSKSAPNSRRAAPPEIAPPSRTLERLAAWLSQPPAGGPSVGLRSGWSRGRTAAALESRKATEEMRNLKNRGHLAPLCSATGAMLVAACTLMIAGRAAAAVHYYFGNVSVPLDNEQPLDLNFENDDFDDVVLENFVFDGVNYQGVTVPYSPGRIVGFADAGVQYATALPAGAPINASTLGPEYYGALAYGTEYPLAQFSAVDDAFIGLAFPVGPTNLHYAWMRVAVDNDAGTLLVKDWAFEDQPGVGIAAGDQGTLPIYGDLNGDRRVNGGDFVAWQRGMTSTYTLFDLWKWQDNFGAGSGLAASSTVATVPEPAAIALTAAALLPVICVRRRWRRKSVRFASR